MVFIISILLLYSCKNENNSHFSFPIQLLHGNSAKVWILSKSNISTDPYFSSLENYRKTLTFHSNNTFRDQELIHLGSNRGQTGKYKIKKAEKDSNYEILLNYSNEETLKLSIHSISNSKLVVKARLNPAAIWEFNTLKAPKI
ncbi:hypothetical protein [Brumimicrobium oceani]|uniref:hypothetical protein n=1 Tax=Brumimicrobium oceani TaxID=2100725 RepID=UPI0011B278A3|nr:hypothetical protein [Brumimicrobium oceani]